MSDIDPFNCDGCHSGNFAGFDHFCDALDVQTPELPYAFAAYLGHRTGWDGFDHFCDDLDVQTPELPYAFAAYLGHRTGWDGLYERVETKESNNE